MHDNDECGHTWYSSKYGELQSIVLYSIILNSYAHSFFHSSMLMVHLSYVFQFFVDIMVFLILCLLCYDDVWLSYSQ